jgi:hypothetical protein
LEKGESALFFSTVSGGVSGWTIHFELLRPGTGKDLKGFLPADPVSNQGEYAFWNDSTISGAPIFVTADNVYGPDETHYSEHRYMISAFTLKPSSLLNEHSTIWKTGT